MLTSNGVKGELTFLKASSKWNSGEITYAEKIYFSFKRKFPVSIQTLNNTLK